MLCPKSIAVTVMLISGLSLYILGLILFCPRVYMALTGRLNETECADGRSTCPPRWICCEQGCCAPGTATPRFDEDLSPRYPLSVLFLIGTLASILVCCLWCLLFKRHSRDGIFLCSLTCCVRRPTSEHDSAGSVYPPPRYSRCNSFHQAPPPYSEVTSKPDMYPLVYTFGDEEAKAGNYLMVHYFRNYVIRAPGSLSATSTAESLNSSFICNAANEANSIIPPPYSCASNYDEYRNVGCGGSLLRSLSSLTEPRDSRDSRIQSRSRTAPDPAPPTPGNGPTPVPRQTESSAVFRENLITSPMQPLQDPTFDLELELIDCELYCDGSCKPRLGSSPPTLRSPSTNEEPLFEREAFGLRHLFMASPEASGACESPPQPTSPTQTSRESTLRRAIDERRLRRLENVKKALKARKSSLYMPLSVAYPVRTSRISPGSRASSRSAPATPCGAFVPNVLTFTQRVASRHGSRSSRLEEENDPLLADPENSRGDHKF